MNIGLIGYGELGKQICNLIQLANQVSETHIFDDILHNNGDKNVLPFSSYINEEYKDLDFYVCLGYKHLIKKSEIISSLNEKNRSIPSFIHPSCHIDPSSEIGDGTIVYPMCNIDKEVIIGKGTLLNNSVTISHNCSIGDFCFLAPGVVISGFAQVNHETFLGSSSVVSNNIKIGQRVCVGIGSVVTSDINDGSSVIGNPMHILNKPLELI
ncbi:MAG: acetyltransferase [Bacteroidia bacterium]|nr:acetyltransferase [Bacteroidia bacterium]